MRKTAMIAAVFLFMLISNCGIHKSPNPVTGTALPEGCAPGSVSYAGIDYASGMISGIVINSQADYISNYIGWAPAGAPTPTPVPVDFNKNTLIGLRIAWDCGTSAGMTGITTDCNAVYLNINRTSNCTTYMCNSFFSYNVYYLIDKTNLPVYIRDITEQCDGTYNTTTASIN